MLSAMTGRHPKALRPRDERAHPVVKDAHDKGYLDTGRDYHIPGMASHDAANEARLSVQRAQTHLGFGMAARVVDGDGMPCWKDCQDPNAPHGVTFKLWSKEGARGHVFHQSQGDPGNLKYNPWKRGERAIVDPQGRRVSG
jgi:hypothetical protein